MLSNKNRFIAVYKNLRWVYLSLQYFMMFCSKYYNQGKLKCKYDFKNDRRSMKISDRPEI